MIILIDTDPNSAKIAAPVVSELGLNLRVESSAGMLLSDAAGWENELDLCIFAASGPSCPELNDLPLLRKRAPFAKYLVTAQGPELPAVIRALRLGALDFLPKPLKPESLASSLSILDRKLDFTLGEKRKIIGRSKAFLYGLKQLSAFSKTRTPVLILGEGGTGRSLLADALCQQNSNEILPPNIINLATIPRPLIGVNLFGFSSSQSVDTVNKSALARANGGSLILKEIEFLPLECQGMLVNFLKTGTYLDTSGNLASSSSARVVAIGSPQLRSLVAKGAFLPELFSLLATHAVEIPPLREREIDIPLLASSFLDQQSASAEKPSMKFSKEALSALSTYDYPGNVSELSAIVHGAMLSADGMVVDVVNLPPHVTRTGEFSKNILDDVKHRTIMKVLADCGGNQTEAANRLGLARGTLNRFLRSYLNYSTDSSNQRF